MRRRRPGSGAWAYTDNKDAAALTAELMAAAHHRQVIRAEIAQAGDEARKLAPAALSERPEHRGFCGETAPPEAWGSSSRARPGRSSWSSRPA